MAATSLMITAQQMRRADELGCVRRLHPDMPEIRKWYGAWWIASPDPVGWLRITDTHLASRLDHIRRRLDIAEDNRAAEQAIRDSQAHQEDPECLTLPAPRSPEYREPGSWTWPSAT